MALSPKIQYAIGAVGGAALAYKFMDNKFQLTHDIKFASLLGPYKRDLNAKIADESGYQTADMWYETLAKVCACVCVCVDSCLLFGLPLAKTGSAVAAFAVVLVLTLSHTHIVTHTRSFLSLSLSLRRRKRWYARISR